ncbi:MAG: Lactate utilization protein A [Desulfovibrio sp.]
MDALCRLAEEIQMLDADLSKCMRCGFCQSHCPIYTETLREFDVSRGKIALLASMGKKLLHDAPGLRERLERCLLCGSCQANCPSGTPAVNIFLRGRAAITTYTGLSPVKKVIFRFFLPRPRLFDLAMKIGSIFQGVVFRTVRGSAQGAVTAPLLSPLLGSRHMHALPKKPLHEAYPESNIPAVPGAPTVLFYPGCMVDRMYVSVGEASLKALRHHGVGICFPADMACCGMPALASGDIAGFEGQVRRTLRALLPFETVTGYGFDFIVSPCGSCTAAIAEQWPHMGEFIDAERTALRILAAKAIDINAFLVDILGVGPARPNPHAPAVTYHDPCHLKKSLKVSAQPRIVIEAAGHTVAEMAESDRCCGCGGSFTVFHYDIARQIGQKKRDMIIGTKAPVAATACPACMMQLNDVLSRNGDRVLVKHSIELYAGGLQ